MIYIDDVRETFDAYYRGEVARHARVLQTLGFSPDVRVIEKDLQRSIATSTLVAMSAFHRMSVATDTLPIWLGMVSSGVQSTPVY